MLDLSRWVTPRVAKLNWLLWDTVSIFTLYFSIEHYIDIFSKIDAHENELKFDSGFYYILMILGMPILHAGQYIINNKKNWWIGRYYGHIAIGTLIVLLILVNTLNEWTKYRINEAGYISCEKTRSRTAQVRGEERVYRLKGCSTDVTNPSLETQYKNSDKVSPK
ncbi:hypothetical protein BGP75_23410 [Motiliproteus sp. MSK22-1]|nr:hypothetical protein BGP75_23410 [Motiliproteus sp. MSK22-1]